MKIRYYKLSNLLDRNKIVFASKLINNETCVTVSDDEISITEDVNDGYGSKVYHEKNRYIECTKEEFDNFYIQTVNKINQLSAL